jgi:catechol 2,3-dioxygenase-like lactoylglutathione lyase family enzyme
MATGAIYHVGIVVNDLSAAISRFSEVFNVTFNEPIVIRIGNESSSLDPAQVAIDAYSDSDLLGSESGTEVVIAYSTQGPLFIELIQAHDRGVYAGAERLHHLGVWESDCDTRIKELEDSGVNTEVIFRNPDGVIRAAYLRPADINGVRLELVNSNIASLGLPSTNGGS